MTPRRTLLAALIVLSAVSAAPTAAQAASPTWLPLATLSQAGVETNTPQVVAAPDGTVHVFWRQSDGSNTRLVATTRLASTLSWSDVVYVSPPGEDVQEGYHTVSDVSGGTTALWQVAGSGILKSASRLAGASDWSEAATLTAAGEANYSFDLARGPDDTVVAAYDGHETGSNQVRTRTRAADSADWGSATDHDQSASDNYNYPAVAFNAAGEGALVWQGAIGSDQVLRGSTYDPETGQWSAPIDIMTSGDPIVTQGLAVAPSGDATAVWGVGAGAPALFSSTFTATAGTWSAPTQLSASGHSGVVFAGVASDSEGNIVTAYQDIENANPYTSNQAMSLTRDAGTGTWSAGEALAPGGAPSLSANARGDMTLAFISSSDGITMQVRSAFRPDGADGWNALQTVGVFNADFAHGLPTSAIGDDGNTYAAWPESLGGENTIQLAAGDGAGPSLGSASVPATGTVGVPVSFSASPFDLWSSVASTGWEFGDGGTGSGTNTTHVYTAPGTYSVTVNATDTAGFSTNSAAGTINIAPAPEPAAFAAVGVSSW